MSIRSVNEIINLSDSSRNPEKLAFKDLVKHIDPRIRDRAPRHTSLAFNIPGILWGQPVFDADKVEKMIIRHYKSMGFSCARLAKREILIKWSADDDGDDGDHDNNTDGTTPTTDSDTDASSTSGEEDEKDGQSQSETHSDTDSDDSDDSDDDDTENTKCVTVEQVPLSKRLSIVNNQMHNM